MKINNGKYTKLKTLEDKIKFTDNIKEIENHLILFEEQLLDGMYQCKKEIELDYKQILATQLGTSKYAKRIINYFSKVELDHYVY